MLYTAVVELYENLQFLGRVQDLDKLLTESSLDKGLKISEILIKWSHSTGTGWGYRYLFCWNIIGGLGLNIQDIEIYFGGTSNSCSSFQFTGAYTKIAAGRKIPKINLYLFRKTITPLTVSTRLHPEGGIKTITTNVETLPGFIPVPWEWIDLFASPEETSAIVSKLMKRYLLLANTDAGTKLSIQKRFKKMFPQWHFTFRDCVPPSQNSFLQSFCEYFGVLTSLRPKQQRPPCAERIFTTPQAQKDDDDIAIDSILESRLCGIRECDIQYYREAKAAAGSQVQIPNPEEFPRIVDDWCLKVIAPGIQLETTESKRSFGKNHFQVFPQIISKHWKELLTQ
jgi:hypothetical protein